MISKICLCMIVKNEKHVIYECFDSIRKYIDSWIICDTGSTDGTQEHIKEYFKKYGIPGELHEHQWVSFCKNRTLAFEAARDYHKKTGLAEYVWVIDADDIILNDLPQIIVNNKLTHDCYHLQYGISHTYFREQIFNNDLKWEYRGVLHEFVVCKDKKETEISRVFVISDDGKSIVDSRRLGARNLTDKKYLIDAELLTKVVKEIKKDKNHPERDLLGRYIYYVGQSYYDYSCQKPENKEYTEHAKYWYQKAIDNPQLNIEERYIANLRIGQMTDKDEYYFRALEHIPNRFEALFYLGKAASLKGDMKKALLYYNLAEKCGFNPIHPLGEKTMFYGMLPLYIAIIHNNNANYEISTTYCHKAMEEKSLPARFRLQALTLLKKNKLLKKGETKEYIDERFTFYPFCSFIGNVAEVAPDGMSIQDLLQKCYDSKHVAVDTYGRFFDIERGGRKLTEILPKDNLIEGIYLKNLIFLGQPITEEERKMKEITEPIDVAFDDKKNYIGYLCFDFRRAITTIRFSDNLTISSFFDKQMLNIADI